MDEHAPIVYDLTQYKEETKHWGTDPSAYLLRYYTKYYFLATSGKELKHLITSNIIDFETGLQVLRGDQFVYQSPNKLCITGLAPTHPLIAERSRYQVLSIRFDPKILTCLPQPTSVPANSKKQPPPPCHSETVICKIEARDLLALVQQSQGDAFAKAESNSGSVPASAAAALNVLEGPVTGSAGIEASKTSSTLELETMTPESQGQTTKPKESVDSSRVLFVVRGAISGHVIELNERLLRRDAPEITDPVVIQTILDKASTHGFIAVIRPKVDKSEIALKDLCTMEDYDRLRQHGDIKVQ
ncbi:hypothetical protein BC939DRAFT_444169 [Gamsiella multidivaricata]|uniref:uncharacterized protein n=1 Tax=Gamsiella multidivaricata TaxID=101098 RepID=UPI00221FD36C|nr:uncharacterized protein BC939DRAFT_444169 [Gamsiella multidivaricata]KAG0371214.1 hypothetical protein BGZ54_008954 [Gamsiella multidivaricata]KAI7827960.1 hypothetical protein BC939DRAFT_444169 [Gamsiella multidivaricata]